MPDARLRARSTAEIVDAAFTLYRQQPLTYILAAAIGNVPSLLASLLLQRGATTTSAALSLAGLALMLLSLVIYGFMSAVVIQLGSKAYLGGAPDLAEALQVTLPRTITVVMAGIARAVAYFIGAIFFLLPFFWVFARYFAIIPAIALEGVGVRRAFARSVALSDGRKRHILNAMGLVWLIFFIVTIGLGALIALFAGTSQVMVSLSSTLVTIIIYPVLALTEMVLYYDARIRGEGYDLERMAESLGVPAVPSRPA